MVNNNNDKITWATAESTFFSVLSRILYRDIVISSFLPDVGKMLIIANNNVSNVSIDCHWVAL